MAKPEAKKSLNCVDLPRSGSKGFWWCKNSQNRLKLHANTARHNDTYFVCLLSNSAGCCTQRKLKAGQDFKV